jgi:two-component system CheB/CheR fusion protein
MCVFARHDLAKDPPFSKLDLIICRNVLVYMDAALQKRVLSIFQYALKPDGFLFLGPSEFISEYSAAFAVEDRKNRIFSRRPVAAVLGGFDLEVPKIGEPAPALPRIATLNVGTDPRKETESILLEHYTPPALRRPAAPETDHA